MQRNGERPATERKPLATACKAVREAVLRDIEAKVAEKMDEVWQKGQQMLAQVQKKQQEKTEQLTAQIVQCKEQQAALERENQALKQVLTDLAQKLMQLGKDSPGLSSAPTTASNTATPQRSDTGPEAEYSSTPLREDPSQVPPFPQPLQPPAPLLLSEALCSSSPMHLSLASTLQACGPMVFSMTLRKADGAELGLNVKPLDEVLLVEGVRPEGAVEAWNRPAVPILSAWCWRETGFAASTTKLTRRRCWRSAEKSSF
ncbi:unnamed protein product [Effrenium voratum]|nr:unnamed protein product [Effrenium voratum]